MTAPAIIPGSTWRGTSRQHRSWRIVVRKVLPYSVEFERLSHRVAGKRRLFMRAAVFRTVIAPDTDWPWVTVAFRKGAGTVCLLSPHPLQLLERGPGLEDDDRNDA